MRKIVIVVNKSERQREGEREREREMEEGNHIEGSSGFAYRKQYFHLLLSKAYNFIALTAAGEHPFNCPSIQVKTGLFRVLKKKNNTHLKGLF